MELIKFEKNGGLVTIHISVEGLVDWRYVYVTDTHRFVKTSGDSEPYIHGLGLPHDLDGDIDAWDIQLANRSDAEQEYKIQITWKQNGEVLKTWSQDGKIAAETAKVEVGSAWLMEA